MISISSASFYVNSEDLVYLCLRCRFNCRAGPVRIVELLLVLFILSLIFGVFFNVSVTVMVLGSDILKQSEYVCF